MPQAKALPARVAGLVRGYDSLMTMPRIALALALALGLADPAGASERGRAYNVMPGRPGAVKVQRDPLAWRQPTFTVRDRGTGELRATCRPDPLAWRETLVCTGRR